MKKMMSILLIALIIFCFPTITLAAQTPGTSETPTNKRGAFEFAELYASRFSILNQELGYKYDMNFMSIPFAHANGDSYSVSTSVADLTISKDDFSVVSAYITLYDLNADKDKNNELCYQAAVALSALEYSGFGYDSGKLNSDKAVLEGIRILSDKIEPIIASKRNSIILSKEELEVYTGNYRYSVVYSSNDDNGRELACFILIANAK